MMLSDFVLVFVSAVLYALGLPNEFLNYGTPLFGFVALVPLLYVLQKRGKVSHSILFGAVFALISSIAVYFWLLFFQDFSVWTLSGVALGHVLYFIFLGPILSAALKYPPRVRPFLVAGVWTVYEFLKSTGYLAFPWGLLSHTSVAFLPLIQISDITGQWGVSFIFALINASILELLINPVPFRKFPKSAYAGPVLFTMFLLV